jgi:hypothetical protein
MHTVSMLHCHVQHCTALQCNTHYTAMHYNAPCIAELALHCTALHCTALPYNTPYTALHCNNARRALPSSRAAMQHKALHYRWPGPPYKGPARGAGSGWGHRAGSIGPPIGSIGPATYMPAPYGDLWALALSTMQISSPP